MTTEREEREWQMVGRQLRGPFGMFWIVVKLLIKKGVFTKDELTELAQAEAGANMLDRIGGDRE